MCKAKRCETGDLKVGDVVKMTVLSGEHCGKMAKTAEVITSGQRDSSAEGIPQIREGILP